MVENWDSKKIHVKGGNIDDVLEIHPSIEEFEPYNRKFFESKLKSKNYIVLLAYVNLAKAGYLIGYQEKDHYYCWLVAIDPMFRGKGILRLLMQNFQSIVKRKGCNKIKIRTKNDNKKMLVYLIKDGYNIIQVVKNQDINNNNIMLEKDI